MGAVLKYISENVMPGLLVILIMGLFNMYTDLLLLKNRVDTQERLIVQQQRFIEKFDDLLQKLDRTLTIQGETVKAIQSTVIRMEERGSK